MTLTVAAGALIPAGGALAAPGPSTTGQGVEHFGVRLLLALAITGGVSWHLMRKRRAET